MIDSNLPITVVCANSYSSAYGFDRPAVRSSQRTGLGGGTFDVSITLAIVSARRDRTIRRYQIGSAERGRLRPWLAQQIVSRDVRSGNWARGVEVVTVTVFGRGARVSPSALGHQIEYPYTLGNYYPKTS